MHEDDIAGPLSGKSGGFLFTARAAQCPPEGAWRTWLFMGGRAAGKTRAGAEWVRRAVVFGGCRRIALVGPAFNDVREVMIEGPSGLRRISRSGERPPVYESSRHRLVWPNGAEAHAFWPKTRTPCAGRSSMPPGATRSPPGVRARPSGTCCRWPCA